MMKELAYKDVTLIPRKSVVMNRAECSTQVEFLGRVFQVPFIPANMKCSIGRQKAKYFSESGLFYILHRFYDYDDIIHWVTHNQSLRTISISVGVQEKDFQLLKSLVKADKRVDFVTIDIAHGHSIAMEAFLKRIYEMYLLYGGNVSKHPMPKIIAGNVATADGVADLVKWGAQAVKVGIGQGHVCTTRTQTGFGMPMFGCVHECSRWTYNNIQIDSSGVTAPYVPIIADGGISYYGDAAKALVAGADMVMAGSMFARCIDSPAETIPGFPQKKKWYGSASEHNKGHRNHIEGIERIESTNGLKYADLILEWQQALQSSISYSGYKKLADLKYTQYARV